MEEMQEQGAMSGAEVIENEGFEVMEVDENDLSGGDGLLEIVEEDMSDIHDSRTLDEVYQASLVVIEETRVGLVVQLANTGFDTQTLWRTEKSIAQAIVDGAATEEQIAAATEVAAAGGESVDEYAAKVLAKAKYLEDSVVMKAAALVRAATKAVKAAYLEAQTLDDEGAGIELIESTLSQKLEAAYSLVS